MVRIRNPWPGRWRFMNINVYVAKVVKNSVTIKKIDEKKKKKSCRQINRNFQKVPTRIQCSTFRGKSCLEEIEHWCRRVFECNGLGARFEVFIIIGRFSPNRKKALSIKVTGWTSMSTFCLHVHRYSSERHKKQNKQNERGGEHKPPYHFHLRQKR